MVLFDIFWSRGVVFVIVCLGVWIFFLGNFRSEIMSFFYLNVVELFLIGCYLIEVSVGIGKIFNIMCIYLCFLLEMCLLV